MTDAMAGMRYGLSRRDLMLYRRVFAAIDESDWATVDATLPHIEDRRLIGHVRAARFLLPGADTQFADLRAWLDVYGDLPEADDIYQLADARKPKGAYLPKAHIGQPSDDDAAATFGDDMGPAEPRTAAGEHAFSRFYASDDKGALADATKAIGALGDRATRSHWIAGLAAWRMGDLKEAGKHFTTLAVSRSASGWLQAAGAYWAGRVDERNGGDAQAAKWFGSASRYPTTFYGMLAQRKLGLDIAQEISAASLTAGHLDALADTPAGYRAVALLELGRRDLASQELEKLDAAGNPKLEEAVIVVTQAGHLNDFSSNLAQRVARPADATETYYPIPRWQPRSGFHVDPALLFAVARQESRFHPEVVNPSGAAGLMQLMPGTASQMAHGHPGSLLDPSTNLELGQRLITTLMQDPNVGENLMLLAVAYNGGSGTPARLQRLLDHDDPLMAVESISKTETRTFIKNVLANYWIYRARLGGDTSSLTELAEGRWPLYRWDAADVGN
ncbi:MAG TPA: lytic transglycosylase domain-containing protein [Alphaproteobacteria bacterium]|jgi:soluble lytic murein transglycosylase-like protein|nr:lytic transglycosylase domain-containing protein [Alphaproteobacteria bacterium]